MKFEDIDRTLLSDTQKQMLNIYEQGFQSTFWTLIEERLEQRFNAAGTVYDTISGSEALGRTQGYRRGLQEMLHLADILADEFRAIVQEQQAPEPEGPEFDDEWH